MKLSDILEQDDYDTWYDKQESTPYEDDLDQYINEILTIAREQYGFNDDMISRVVNNSTFYTYAQDSLDNDKKPEDIAWRLWKVSQEDPNF